MKTIHNPQYRSALALAVSAIVSSQAFASHPNTIESVDDSGNRSSALLETMTVTATREKARLVDTAASIGVISEETINDITATHSADVLNRIAGVNIAQLGSTSQGVAAAIRQPISYGPVYLYLENGVPTRSPAFFNHNALYEVNVSQANGAEVIKGPGSALYGSDAIGGVVNILTGKRPKEDRITLTAEGGDDNWKRLQASVEQVLDDSNSFTVRAEWTDTDGWREHTENDRQSLSSSWQTEVGAWSVNSVFSGSQIDMNTGGSGLREDDFDNNPELAGNLIGYRDVSAYRLSSAWDRPIGDGSLSITPYYRNNDLEYVATWTLNTGRNVFIPWLGISQLDSQDAHINESGHDSLGVLVKYKQPIDALDDGFWITGVDVDYSQGYQKQTYITRTDDDPGNYWLSYQREGLIYDYEVDYISTSPYIHTEGNITDRVRFSAGLRYDYIEYEYDNNLSVNTDSNSIHKRPANTRITMDHLSPKLGLVVDITDQHNAYAAYRHAFRIPSSGQLFRSGRTEDSTNLDPVTADSYEIGVRGQMNDAISYDLALYYMTKEDDIISVTDATGARRNTNAGETSHKGVELSVNVEVAESLDIGTAYTRSQHTYEQWQPNENTDYSGNDIINGPRSFTNVYVNYHPNFLNGGRVELEWRRQGAHYIDEANTVSYSGHTLMNVRASYQLNDDINVYANMLNATDEAYAETTSKWGPQYTPGRPRTIFAGIKYAF